jgi:heat shock protein HslJ
MNTRSHISLLTIILIFAFTLIGCTPATDAPGDTGDNSSLILGGWNAVTIDGENVIQPTVPNIIFNEDGTVVGNGSCNGFSGTYTVDGSNVTIGEVIATEMGCMEQELNIQESNFFNALTRVTGFTREGDTLNLTAADGTIIISLTQVMG